MADAPRSVRVVGRRSAAGFATDLLILSAGVAVALWCVLASPGAGSLQAQAPQVAPSTPVPAPPPELPKAPEPQTAVPPPPTAAPAVDIPKAPESQPAAPAFTAFPTNITAVAPPLRFQFKIDPETPLKDLLPEAPRAERKKGPLFPAELSLVPELAFAQPLPRDLAVPKAMERTAHQIAKINHLNLKKSDAFLEALLASRPDLAGLPFAMGDACRTKGERTRQFNLALNTVRQALQQAGGIVTQVQTVSETVTVKTEKGDVNQVVARTVPVQVAVTGPPRTGNGDAGTAFWDAYLNTCAQEDRNNTGCSREQQEHVTLARIAALVQVLGPESLELRRGLVKYLATVSHPEATRQLARLALFAQEAEVRERAVEALKVRRERDYTDVLLQGLHYPWPNVARHASEAMIALERKDLLPQLVAVLDEPDPRLPATREVEGKQVPAVRELVKLNHHRNCLMCHSPGNTPTVSPDAVTAQVPVPGEPLPSLPSGYQGNNPDMLVRVDVTYLRQDFSLKLPVADAGPWPEMQRFDFVVRTRALSEEEAQAYRKEAEQREPGVLSPYHRAALLALRELTGRDTAPTAAAWRELLGLRRSDSE